MSNNIYSSVIIENVTNANLTIDDNGNLYNLDYKDIYYQKDFGIQESFYTYVDQSKFLTNLTRNLIRNCRYRTIFSENLVQARRKSNSKLIVSYEGFNDSPELERKLGKQKLICKNFSDLNFLNHINHLQELVQLSQLCNKHVNEKKVTPEQYQDLNFEKICKKRDLADCDKEFLRGTLGKYQEIACEALLLKDRHQNTKANNLQAYKIFELGYGSGLNCLLTFATSKLYRELTSFLAPQISIKSFKTFLTNYINQLSEQDKFIEVFQEWFQNPFNQNYLHNLIAPLTSDSCVFEFFANSKQNPERLNRLFHLVAEQYCNFTSRRKFRYGLGEIIGTFDTNHLLQYVSAEKHPISRETLRTLYQDHFIPDIVEFSPEIVKHVINSAFDLDLILNLEDEQKLLAYLLPQVNPVSLNKYQNFFAEQVSKQTVLQTIFTEGLDKGFPLYRNENFFAIFDSNIHYPGEEKEQLARYLGKAHEIAIVTFHLVHRLALDKFAQNLAADYQAHLKTQDSSLEAELTQQLEDLERQVYNFVNPNLNLVNPASVGRDLLQIHYGDVLNILENNLYNFANQFDSIYLDGFNVKTNEVPWSAQTCAGLAYITKPLATLSSFASNKQINTHLTLAGFISPKAKIRGFHKREIFTGRIYGYLPLTYLLSALTLRARSVYTVKLANKFNEYALPSLKNNLKSSDFVYPEEYDSIQVNSKKTSTRNVNFTNKLFACHVNADLSNQIFARTFIQQKEYLLNMEKTEFCIWGAGIAGLNIADYASSLGIKFEIIDKTSPLKASKNPVGLIYPQLTDDDPVVTWMYCQAFGTISQKIETEFEQKYNFPRDVLIANPQTELFFQSPDIYYRVVQVRLESVKLKNYLANPSLEGYLNYYQSCFNPTQLKQSLAQQKLHTQEVLAQYQGSNSSSNLSSQAPHKLADSASELVSENQPVLDSKSSQIADHNEFETAQVANQEVENHAKEQTAQDCLIIPHPKAEIKDNSNYLFLAQCLNQAQSDSFANSDQTNSAQFKKSRKNSKFRGQGLDDDQESLNSLMELVSKQVAKQKKAQGDEFREYPSYELYQQFNAKQVNSNSTNTFEDESISDYSSNSFNPYGKESISNPYSLESGYPSYQTASSNRESNLTPSSFLDLFVSGIRTLGTLRFQVTKKLLFLLEETSIKLNKLKDFEDLVGFKQVGEVIDSQTIKILSPLVPEDKLTDLELTPSFLNQLQTTLRQLKDDLGSLRKELDYRLRNKTFLALDSSSDLDFEVMSPVRSIRGYKLFVMEYVRAKIQEYNQQKVYVFHKEELLDQEDTIEESSQIYQEIEDQAFKEIDVKQEDSMAKYILEPQETYICPSVKTQNILTNEDVPVPKSMYSYKYWVAKQFTKQVTYPDVQYVNFIATGASMITKRLANEYGIYPIAGKISISCLANIKKAILQVINKLDLDQIEARKIDYPEDHYALGNFENYQVNPLRKLFANEYKYTKAILDVWEKTSIQDSSYGQTFPATTNSQAIEFITDYLIKRIETLLDPDVASCHTGYSVVCRLTDFLLFNAELNPPLPTQKLYSVCSEPNQIIVVFGATANRGKFHIGNYQENNRYNVYQLLQYLLGDELNPQVSELICEQATEILLKIMEEFKVHDLVVGCRVGVRDRFPVVGLQASVSYLNYLIDYNKTQNKGGNFKNLPKPANLVNDQDLLGDLNLKKNERYYKQANKVLEKLPSPPGLARPLISYLVGGFAGRGLTVSRLLTIHAVNEVLGLVSPLPDGLVHRIHPQRLAIKKALTDKIDSFSID